MMVRQRSNQRKLEVPDLHYQKLTRCRTVPWSPTKKFQSHMSKSHNRLNWKPTNRRQTSPKSPNCPRTSPNMTIMKPRKFRRAMVTKSMSTSMRMKRNLSQRLRTTLVKLTSSTRPSLTLTTSWKMRLRTSQRAITSLCR